MVTLLLLVLRPFLMIAFATSSPFAVVKVGATIRVQPTYCGRERERRRDMSF